ncbi:hypothetical protein [Serratia silvae]|uniref:Uncharacterized protein n=1 Tax=Serratia silvae TaxID=2824122 RepID=A0ABT0KB25_9GAMM|nr:hypothetical protein [Serratia silvae]MCL1029231.1 hypothetical protein [Serratia silvae]
MKKIEASVQHVSIFRIRNIYLIGVLYDFESDNQEGSLDVIIQGNSISFGINEASGPKTGRTATATATVHILSATDPIQAFNVNKGSNTVITVPVFSLKRQDQLNVAGELIGLFSAMRQTLSVVPKTTSGLPVDVIAELDIDEEKVSLARDWGWKGW